MGRLEPLGYEDVRPKGATPRLSISKTWKLPVGMPEGVDLIPLQVETIGATHEMIWDLMDETLLQQMERHTSLSALASNW